MYAVRSRRLIDSDFGSTIELTPTGHRADATETSRVKEGSMIWHIGSAHEHGRRRRGFRAAIGSLATGIAGVALAAAPAQAALPGCTVAALTALGVRNRRTTAGAAMSTTRRTGAATTGTSGS